MYPRCIYSRQADLCKTTFVLNHQSNCISQVVLDWKWVKSGIQYGYIKLLWSSDRSVLELKRYDDLWKMAC